MTDNRVLKSAASFSEQSLRVDIEFTCKLAKSKEFMATATAFDSSDQGVPFIKRKIDGVNMGVVLTTRRDKDEPETTFTFNTQYSNQISLYNMFFQIPWLELSELRI